MLTPILAFTAEEIWALMPHRSGAETESVLYNPIPEPNNEYVLTPEQESMWESVLNLRSDVYKALEIARIDKVIGKSLEAEVTLYLDSTASAAFEKIADKDYKAVLIVSAFNVINGTGKGYDGTDFPGATVSVRASEERKCARCWKHGKDVGRSDEHPQLCPRCLDVVL